jgi:hypothetical protein
MIYIGNEKVARLCMKRATFDPVAREIPELRNTSVS